jgi:tRNA(Ile)-lysidine synthase
MMSFDPFLQQADAYIRKNRLIGRGEKIVTAVSGGIDSIVLLDCLASLRDEYGITLAIAHFNHHLRGAGSDADEDFVRQTAVDMNISFITGGADVGALSESEKLSIQEAARNARYAFFEETRASLGFEAVATAHHADDNTETMIMNFFRGSGVSGMSGIPPRRNGGNIIRPLLFARREEISSYARRRGLSWREDPTNAGTDYTRNAVRHRIVPLIKEICNPGVTPTLLRTAVLFRELGEYLAGQAAKVSSSIIARSGDGAIILNRDLLLAQPRFLREVILRDAIAELTGSQPGHGMAETMMEVCEGETGSHCPVGGGMSLYRDRDRLLLAPSDPEASYEIPVQIGREYVFPSFSFRSSRVDAAEIISNPNVEYADESALELALNLRNWKSSDWFIPLGMEGKKKLSDFFIDSKVPLPIKRSVPILVSGGNVVWVCGMRLDERCRISPHTTRIIKLEYTPLTAP